MMIPQLLTFFGDAGPCPGGDFLGFPKWYKYLGHQMVTGKDGQTSCAPQITGLSDIWLIVASVIELLLRIGALAAIVYALYGSIQFITSQGDPSKTQAARQTIINALVGLVISVGAATLVTFLAGGFK
ncbi:MAG TPA: pilin [Candidatus Saccharimonadales bacterium]|nr:pilin [Candidatus Saccharimonadales bacterium]